MPDFPTRHAVVDTQADLVVYSSTKQKKCGGARMNGLIEIMTISENFGWTL